MKKQAMRVNRTATLGSIPFTPSNSNSYVRVEPLLMERTEHTAAPRTFNHMKDGQVYAPEKSEPVRSGAMDALRIPSRGYPT
jgi:hypothetical protein